MTDAAECAAILRLAARWTPVDQIAARRRMELSDVVRVLLDAQEAGDPRAVYVPGLDAAARFLPPSAAPPQARGNPDDWPAADPPVEPPAVPTPAPEPPAPPPPAPEPAAQAPVLAHDPTEYRVLSAARRYQHLARVAAFAGCTELVAARILAAAAASGNAHAVAVRGVSTAIAKADAPPRQRRRAAPAAPRDQVAQAWRQVGAPELQVAPPKPAPKPIAKPPPVVAPPGLAAARRAASQDDFTRGMLAARPALMQFAWKLTGNRTAAEDLVQGTFLNALQARDSFQPGTNLKAWLKRILFNAFRSNSRRASARRAHLDIHDPDVAHALPSVRPDAYAAIERLEVAEHIAALPADQRHALLRIGRDGASYEQLAAESGVPVGTLKCRVFRARENLRDAFGPLSAA